MKKLDLSTVTNFDLISALTTIRVNKLQKDVWKVVENGNYAGEKTDSEVTEMVDRLQNEGFKLHIPELNY